MIRTWTLFDRCRLLSLGLLLAGCSGADSALRFETASEPAADERRRPAGVALDPESRLPEPAARGDTAQLLVVLQPPADPNAAQAVVKAFFDAVIREDLAELEKLVDDDASLALDRQGSKRRARATWRTRLAQLDYDRLPARELYRESEVEIYKKDDFDRLTNRALPQAELGDDDIVLRVPMLITKLDKVRLFGDEIVFVLKPEGRSFKIVEMIEPYQPQ